jgi:transcriptional regulator with XRE-family HTH domain
LENIRSGEYVYTHTGEYKIVENNFAYDVNEECIEIKTRYAFDTIKLTNDHKVYGSKSIDNEPSWFKASELNVGNYIWMPFIKNRNIKIWNESNKESPVIDLANYSCEYENVSDEYIIQAIPLDNDLSIRSISKKSGISRNTIKNIINNSNKTKKSKISKLESYLNKFSTTLEEWKVNNNTYTKQIKRFIPVNNEFYYFIGRWVGDGWILTNNGDKSYEGGVAFNSDDIDGINRIFNYLSLLGLNPVKRPAKNGKKLIQIIFRGFCFYNFLEKTFDGYKKTSKTKHLPSIFRNLCEVELKSLLLGYFDSDGSVDMKSNRESFDTTSERLALEIKEALLYLNIPSTIMTRQPHKRGKYNCSKSYKIRFTGFETSHKLENVLNIKNDGYYCQIIELNKINLSKVYDIHVKDNHSYLTSNYAVHNSVGGSFVAYLLDIHKADPLKYDLIFARFHNKEKKFFPDCDNDFGDSIRQDVINYLSEKYGHDCVAHVSNINKITPKVYVRDLCRALELGGSRELAIDFGNKIANSIPKEIHSIDQALNDAPLFGEWCKRFPELIKYKKLDNQLRASSTHAAGLIVSKRSLIGLVPCRKDNDGSMAIEYSKDPCEENGLVKIDMLGLKTLDIINNTYSLIKQSGLDKPNFKVEECDEKAYDLISSGDTFGVFQFGTSGGTIDLCKKIKPKNIEELSMINSLARPSSKEIRAPFVKARDLNKSTTLLHPKLQRSLGSTFGFSIYEESLMFLAFDIANWNLNEADVLRKLTKEKGKNPAKAEKIKQKFILDSVKNGIDENIATRIWTEIIEYYAKYGFNKSHSVLYSMTSYHTAYLKAHYPVQFLLSNLMSEDDSNALNADSNISQIKEEIRKSGIEILKPSLNESERNYKIINNKMLTGFASMKRLQDKAIEEIIEKRPFTSLQDFVQRIDQSKVQLPTVQALIACGCFDDFGHSRKSLFLFFKDFRDKFQRFSKKKNGSFEYVFPNDDWTLSEKYALEVEYMGEAFICNQTEAYSHFYGNVYTPVLTKLLNFEEKAKVESMRAIIKDIFTFPVKKEGSKMLGREMAKLTLLDKDLNRFSATIFPDLLDNLKSRKIILEPELGIFFEGTINYYQDEFGVIIDSVYNISQPPSLPKDRKSTKLIKDFKENKPESDNSLVNDLLDFIS